MTRAAVPPTRNANAAFPWRHPHNQIFHTGDNIPITDNTVVKLGIRHRNYTITCSLAALVAGQLATSVSADRIAGQDGSFLITARDAAGAVIAFGTKGGINNATQVSAYNITPGQTTKFKVDGGTTYTKTWAGTRAVLTGGAATYASLDTKTLQVGVTVSPGNSQFQTVTLDASCVDRASTITYLNTALSGMITVAPGAGSSITLTNITAYGTAAQVIVGLAGASNTALAALGLTASATAYGTGDAAYLAQTTAAEAAAALNAVLVGATATPSQDNQQRDIYVYTNTVGSAGSIQFDATSTQSLNMPDSLVHSGTGGTEVVTCYANFFVIEGDPGARSS